MAIDLSILREVNPELADAIEGATNQPSSPYDVMAAQYPAIAEFIDNLGLPAGGAGLFHTGFKHAKIDTAGDDVLSGFDLAVLQSMPRVSGPGQAQIADRRGRQHDVYSIMQKLDRMKGISYSADANPSAANKLLGGN